MNISGINASQALNFLGIENNKNIEQIADKAIQCITDIFSQSDDTTKFKEIVDKYDITNISQTETKELYNELYQNGLISLQDKLTSLDPSKIPGIMNSDISTSDAQISANPDEKFNLLEQLKAQADYNKKNGNPQRQNAFNERLHLAEKIFYFQT